VLTDREREKAGANGDVKREINSYVDEGLIVEKLPPANQKNGL